MHFIIRFCSILITILGITGSLAANPLEPLLMTGKKTLFQKVLARPGIQIHKKPNLNTAFQAAIPLNVYYVYARQEGKDGVWFQVGSNRHGKVIGWVQEKHLIEWKQALTIVFGEPLGQDRVLLFRDRESLQGLITSGDLSLYHRHYRQAQTGQTDEHSPVIAIQPKHYVDVLQDFYLIPIISYEDVFLGGEQARMLQVATATLQETEPAMPTSMPISMPVSMPVSINIKPKKIVASKNNSATKSYRSGIVFVVDTTRSMEAYIDRTRETVRKVYQALEEANLMDKVNFGLVAYRDNIRVSPRLEYVTRLYATLKKGKNPKSFFAGVDSIRAATTSSRRFREDAYAGIKEALEHIDWQDFAARYIILVTDASAREGGDPLGKTGLDTESIRQLAYDNRVALWVLHLLTPWGKFDHHIAEQQYRKLSEYPGIGSFYYGVKTGQVDTFGRVLEALTAQITQQVRETVLKVPLKPVTEKIPVKINPLAQLQTNVDRLGYALRMRYLGEKQKGHLPDLFNAWLLDHSFRNPEKTTLEVRVLLTRDQLSDMQNVLTQVLTSAEEGLYSPGNFLDDLKSVAAAISRDPTAVGSSAKAAGSVNNLAELGYMREYLEGLPYTGDVMKLALDDWQTWSAKKQLKFIHKLESKINYYRALYENTDLWVSLDGGPVTGDSVLPVDLEMLP